MNSQPCPVRLYVDRPKGNGSRPTVRRCRLRRGLLIITRAWRVGAQASDFKYVEKQKCFDVLAVDQFLDRKWIANKIQPKKIIQGNLDPIFLTQRKEILLPELRNITEDFKNHPYIFNLGHGITPDALVENVELVVDYIKGLKY